MNAVMTATRAAFLGGGYGGVSGGIAGGSIAQFFFGSDTHILPLWVAAFLGAIVAGVLSALATRSSQGKSSSADGSAEQTSHHP
jgi:ABC-type Fe3+-siderophore transport system permease subunit